MKKKIDKPVKKKGKRVLLNILFVLVLFLGIAAILAGNMYYNEKNYTIEFYKESSDKIENRVRMVFLTDIHLHEYGKNNSELLNDVKNLSPDLIILGGDLVIDQESDYSNMLSLCKSLVDIAPVYGVLGNHEDVRVFLKNDDKLIDSFNATGIKLLRNASETVTVNGTQITILGVEGSVDNFDKYGAKAFMDSCKENKSDTYTVCVSHVPMLFVEKLSDYNFDLGLAGHVHGGIVEIPRIGGLYSYEEGWLPKYTSGTYELKNGADLIVSRGLGNSRKIPRLNNTPELSVIDLS